MEIQGQSSKVWGQVLKQLERDLTPASFANWIMPLSFYNEFEGDFVLIAPDKTTKETIELRYKNNIQNAITQITRSDCGITIILPGDVNKKPGFVKETNADRETLGSTLKNKYVFENFVRGKSNELAFAASVAVAEAPGLTTYNPLFLYGGVGLGKTHLMHSIGNFILHSDPATKVLYTSAENLMNEFINSIRERKNQEFRDKYRNVDVLLVDDIQFLSGKDETQEEFFHTFNALYSANKQIVISSDRPPSELKTLEDRLTSRFKSGLPVDITLPDFETRSAILEKKAEIERLDIPPEVIRFVAKNISSNIRELEGALTKVTAYAKLTNSDFSLELAERAIKDMFGQGQGKREITVELIQEIVSAHYKIKVEEMRSKKRTAEISNARQIAMYFCRMLVNAPLIKIGELFGGRDHTTVIHGCNKIAEDCERSKEKAEELLIIEAKIKGE